MNMARNQKLAQLAQARIYVDAVGLMRGKIRLVRNVRGGSVIVLLGAPQTSEQLLAAKEAASDFVAMSSLRHRALAARPLRRV